MRKIYIWLFMYLMSICSCNKSNDNYNIKCYNCYKNNTNLIIKVYDTCVVGNTRTYRDETFNCYLIR